MRSDDQIFIGISVCATGLALHIKEQIRKIVVACGGCFQDDFTLESTTHLIADSVGSHKYRAALMGNISIVSSRWIFESFRAHTLLDIAPYTLRILEGLVLCTTGLSAQSRTQVEQLAQQHGGVYDANLEVGRTQILIAQSPSGAKYEAAMTYNIPVVHISWLHACIEKGALVDENLYSLENVLQPRHLLRQLRNDLDEMMGTQLKPLIRRYWKEQKQEGICEDEEFMWLLDGCGFYLLGFSPEMEIALRFLIRTAMGTVYDEFVGHNRIGTMGVSHVLVSPVPVDGIHILEQLENEVVSHHQEAVIHFVSAQWLIDTLKCLRLEPEEMYPVEIEEQAVMNNTNVPNNTNSRAFSVHEGVEQVSLISNEEPTVELHAIKNVEEAKETNLFFQKYGFVMVCTNPMEPLIIKQTLKAIQQVGGGQAVALDYRDIEHMEPEQFDFITHVVICSGVNLHKQVVENLRRRFLAFDPIRRDSSTTRNDEEKRKRTRKGLRFVSDLWVRCCLSTKCVLSSQSHELFALTHEQPRSMFDIPLPLACFRSIYVSTSVYVGVDRAVVIELLTMAGAHVTSKLSKQNTHLVCLNPIGMKYEKAREWKLKIVTARWVVQSVIRGELLDTNLPEFQVTE